MTDTEEGRERATMHSTASAPVIEERMRVRTRRYGAIAVTLGAFALIVSIATAGGVSYLAVQNNRNGQILVDCTTPGPTVPTEEEPSTGHDCYDRGRAQTGEAIVVIVDEVDRRTCLRMQEALTTALNREVRLTCPVPTAAPPGSDAGP